MKEWIFRGRGKKLKLFMGAIVVLAFLCCMPQFHAQAAGKNGVNKASDGNWYYYYNDRIQTSYNSLAKHNGYWWYFKNGKLDFGYTGLCKYNGNWFYVSGGKVNFHATGLCKYNGSWWYVENGKVNFNKKTLCKFNGYWWYISGGKVNFNATGLCKYNGNWYYISGGKVNFTATGLCKYNGNWYYISGGKVNFNATGLCKYNGNWYYISGGKVNFNATGLCKYNNAWWYVENGKVNFSANTLCKYNGSWWYISGGKVDFNYSGYVQYNGAIWYIKNGKMVHQAGDKIVYLTFDDGPGPYTKRLLDILDEYGIKVTFFVTNQEPEYQYLIGEAHRRGHTIALHTYDHDYRIYRSEEAYYEDLQNIQNICVAQTGVEAKIVRFPGGTSNTISRNYKKGIMSSLAKNIGKYGYLYCDWNVSSEDAGGTNTESGVYQNVVNGIRRNRISVVLQHDIKSFSVEAVDDIIRWGMANGYTFLPMTENTPMVHHGANN